MRSDGSVLARRGTWRWSRRSSRQRRGDRAIGQHVVRRDAGLPGVEQLGPRDPAGRDVQIGVGQHHDRALAAEFQRHRRQRRRGRRHDLAADLGAAGEQRVVEALGQQILGASRRRPRPPGWRRESRYCGTSRAISAEVAGASSDGLITAALPAATAATSGAMHRIERVVPRADHQHHAERVVLHPGAARAAAPAAGPAVSASSTSSDACGRTPPRPWWSRRRRATPRTPGGRDPSR